MQWIYGCMILGKIGHIYQLIAKLTFEKGRREDFPPLDQNYPSTPEGDERFYNHSLFVIAQHLVTISLMLIVICLLRRNLKWARRVNPILLTLAFMFDLPVFQVNMTYYFVLIAAVNMACACLMPWMVCETLAG